MGLLREELWRPSSCRPPLPGEYDAWVERSRVEKEQLRQGRREAYEARLADEAERRAALAMTPAKAGAKRFSTDAAIRWGKSQGWTYLDRERWDAITKRHRDLQLATDALFDDGTGGLIAIQGAGRYERTEHRARFEAAGGEATAKRRGIRVAYVEFVRGGKEPVVIEWWS